MSKVKVFISQPMHGLTLDEIIKVRENVISVLKDNIGDCFEFIDNLQANEEYIANAKKHPRLWYLGESIKLMSEAFCIVMADGWQNSQGCLIEKEIADQYSIPVVIMADPN